MKKLVVSLLFIVLFYSQSKSQSVRKVDVNGNNWIMLVGNMQINSKWSMLTEGQIRRSNLGMEDMQNFIRFGLNRNFNPNLSFTGLGYLYAMTFPYGDFPVTYVFPEHRIWQQLVIKTKINSTEFSNRIRLEQRFIGKPSTTAGKEFDWVYKNRIRFQTKFNIPLTKSGIVNGKPYLAVSDELFVSFGKNVKFNNFDQNRFYLAIGMPTEKLGRFEVGYLNQNLLHGNGVELENNHTIQLGWYPNYSIKKKK